MKERKKKTPRSKKVKKYQRKKEQVRSENDASEWTFWDILGHLQTHRDNSEYFFTSLEHLDCFPSHFRPFSPIIGLFRKTRSGATDPQTDRKKDRKKKERGNRKLKRKRKKE